jgi:hypothetical protein
MELEEIVWNGLYTAQPGKQRFAKKRIEEHFTRSLTLSRRGVVKAVVRYSMNLAFIVVALTSFCRPTGFHGESGTAKAGGHITVDFYRRDNKFITTHHVYPTDKAYRYR